MPLTGDDNHFAIKEIALASDINLLSRQFITICLIDNISERSSFSSEISSFGINPDKFPESYWPPYLQPDYNPGALLGSKLTTEGLSVPASIIWWPIEGLPNGEDPTVYLKSPGWNLSGLIDNIVYLSKSMTNAAIYIHCMLGADRTGAVVAGYLMKTHGLNVDDAVSKTSQMTSAGVPNGDYLRLIRAYSGYIK